MANEIKKAFAEAEKQLPPNAFLVNTFAWRRLRNELRKATRGTNEPTA